ncbi:MAG: glycosyltransferase [Candidatus Omnitrophica bacterium]|nr:glycosyltransferase [Candidatus Omnitrophota bacterium]
MIIIQILPEMKIGGVETGTVDVARSLTAQGHRAIVISAGGPLVGELERAGVRHYTLPVHKKSLPTALRMVFAVRRIIRREQADIVHARSRVPAWIAYAATRLTRAAFITTCHGHYSPHFFSRIMGRGRRVIVISEHIGRHMISAFGTPRERLQLIYRGVDLSRFSFRGFYTRSPRQGAVVGIVGRITPLKGHVYFIRAMAELRRQFPGLRARIIGDAPDSRREYLQRLQALVKELGLSDVVEFCGAAADVRAALQDLDVLVMATTTAEAFGRVIIEAGAVGVPVVATAVGGVVEIITDGKEGLLAEPENVPALAAAVRRCIEDAPAAAERAAAFRRRVEQCFSSTLMIEKTIALYRDILAKKKIVVFKLSALGDVILAVPSLRALRAHYPQAAIDVVVRPEYRAVLTRCPYIDSLICWPRKNFRGALTTLAHIRRAAYALSFDFQNNVLTHWLAFLGGCSARHGYRNHKWGVLLNQGIAPVKLPLRPVEHQFQILRAAGIPARDDSLELWVAAEEHTRARNFLREQGWDGRQRLVGIHATASPRWATKTLFPEQIAQLADALAEQFQAKVFFTGSAADRSGMQAIIEQAETSPLNCAGRTDFALLAAVIAQAAVFICGDSAPLHIAAALQVPCVAVFGPTDPERHLPRFERTVVVRKRLSCAPCYRATCAKRTCMRLVRVEDICRAVETLLQPQPRPG